MRKQRLRKSHNIAQPTDEVLALELRLNLMLVRKLKTTPVVQKPEDKLDTDCFTRHGNKGRREARKAGSSEGQSKSPPGHTGF